MQLCEKIFYSICSRLYRFYKFGNSVYCCLCGKKALRFFPYRGGYKNIPPLIRALDGVGSDVNNFGCPHCGCSDRERHLYLYLDRLSLWGQFQNASILHFAPEEALSKVIESMHPKKWIRADLFPTRPEFEKVDLLAIPYEDSKFDIVIVNHVLEHVPDDIKALKEIYRVLRPGGLAILQTPYCQKLEDTLSDNGIDNDNARLQAYGQEDHLRLYGRDIFTRIESTGFRSRTVSHQQTLSDVSPRYFGVNPEEPLFLFEKP